MVPDALGERDPCRSRRSRRRGALGSCSRRGARGNSRAPRCGLPGTALATGPIAEIARTEHERGRSVVVTAGPSEAELARHVARLAGISDECIWTGTDPLALLSVVAAAARVVCGDTGVAHVATAVGTPSVVLFGPISPALWGPPPSRTQHIALWAGRSGEPNAATVDSGLLEIGVEDVLAALSRLS